MTRQQAPSWLIDKIERLIREDVDLNAAVDQVLEDGLGIVSDRHALSPGQQTLISDSVLARVLDLGLLDFDAWPYNGERGKRSVDTWIDQYADLVNDRADTTHDGDTNQDLVDWEPVLRAMLTAGWFKRWPYIKPTKKDVMLAFERAGILRGDLIVHPGQGQLLGLGSRDLRGEAPYIQNLLAQGSLKELVAWLKWADPNGDWDDDGEYGPVTLDAAKDYIRDIAADILAGNGLSGVSENDLVFDAATAGLKWGIRVYRDGEHKGVPMFRVVSLKHGSEVGASANATREMAIRRVQQMLVEDGFKYRVVLNRLEV